MDFIYEDIGAVPDSLCDRLIEIFEANKELHVDGNINPETSESNKKIKNNIEMFVTDEVDAQEIKNLHNHCLTSLEKYVNYLREHSIDRGNSKVDSLINYSFQRFRISYPQIQKNVVGNFFDWHIDKTEKNDRLLHFITYLNDVDDDSGGETEFSNGRIIKPQKGKILIFPCTFFHVHRGKELLKGEKYITSVLIYTDEECVHKSEFPFLVR
jgi:hypothetical protein